MLTTEFDFHLPDELIAQHPATRGESRLLDTRARAKGRHRGVADLAALLNPGDLLIANDTKVIPARLYARRQPGGGKTEILLVEKVDTRSWQALLRPGRRAKPGTRLLLAPDLEAEVCAKEEDGRHLLLFNQAVEPFLDTLGHVPLPPYIKRPDQATDRDSYQTIFAKQPGAIAAPTAGLHFTPELLQTLAERGIERATITLHVGIGTFKPVTATLLHEHKMDIERYEVPAATAAAIQATQQRRGRVVAVGTTVVRCLESVARETGVVSPGPGSTDLFITPGFRFRVVDLLLTNFHLPCSTLLMLVSALAGQEKVKQAYEEAIRKRYRFYSYGDAMLLEREETGA
jgi:S-adenosylmethionine:tRNA ribosyltransferase-isomerase